MPTHKLLIIDNDTKFLNQLSKLLGYYGFAICKAHSIAESRQLLTQSPPVDLAIINIDSADGSGLVLVQKLRDIDHIPSLLISSLEDTVMMNNALDSGAFAYFVKPLNIQQLLLSIETAVDTYQELRELREARDQLQNASNADREINISVGITMMKCKISKQEAFELLRKTARSQRRKLTELASEINTASETSIRQINTKND